MQGDHAAAGPLLEESEQLCRMLGSDWELAYLLRKLAEHAAQAGELKQAVKYAQESFTLAQKLGDKSLIATVLSTLGNIPMPRKLSRSCESWVIGCTLQEPCIPWGMWQRTMAT